MKALVHGARVVQIVPDRQDFPVAPPLKWIDAPDGTTTDHSYDGNRFVAPSSIPPPAKARVIDAQIAGNDALHGLIDVLAERFGTTPAALIADLKTKRGA